MLDVILLDDDMTETACDDCGAISDDVIFVHCPHGSFSGFYCDDCAPVCYRPGCDPDGI